MTGSLLNFKRDVIRRGRCPHRPWVNVFHTFTEKRDIFERADVGIGPYVWIF